MYNDALEYDVQILNMIPSVPSLGLVLRSPRKKPVVAAKAAQQRTVRPTQTPRTASLLLCKPETTLTAGSSARGAVYIWCLRIILELVVGQSRIFALRKRTAHGWLRGLERSVERSQLLVPGCTRLRVTHVGRCDSHSDQGCTPSNWGTGTVRWNAPACFSSPSDDALEYEVPVTNGEATKMGKRWNETSNQAARCGGWSMRQDEEEMERDKTRKRWNETNNQAVDHPTQRAAGD